MKLLIGSHSQGGTGYLTRIIKAAQTHDHVDIEVSVGQYQEQVRNKVCGQLDMLHKIADIHFTYAITVEPCNV